MIKFFPTQDQFHKLREGKAVTIFAFPFNVWYKAEVGDLMVVKEPHKIEDNIIEYGYDNPKYKAHFYTTPMMMPTKIARYNIKVIGVRYIPFNEVDEIIAQHLGWELDALKRIMISSVPKKHRRDYGAKDNPIIKFMDIEWIVLDNPSIL